jgi:hypothetical protein
VGITAMKKTRKGNNMRNQECADELQSSPGRRKKIKTSTSASA